MHGRPPIAHLWPLNQCLPKVDISDPHTFLSIKRGILQYAWLKPILAIATTVMKATGTYQEGYIGLTSGYFWSGFIYNISITVCLYALALFWVCMSKDLKPFRPMPKFISIKGIIVASYWQGFFLSILVWLGAIPDVPGYSPDNLAASIQDALICYEMPFFALLHWYAFSWHDYADVTISAARMPIKYALRDAFGPVDLIQDAKETFAGTQYEYRQFDAGDNVLAHEESAQRVARISQGMRFSRDGKGKYWIPNPHEIGTKTPLLNKITGHDGDFAAVPSHSGSTSPNAMYGTTTSGYDDIQDDPYLDDDDEELFTSARELEFGDWNYPVITAHNATREDRLYAEPGMITASTNRHLLQATKENRSRRKSRISQIQKDVGKGKHRRPELSPVRSDDEEDFTQAGESAIVDDRASKHSAEGDEEHRGRSGIISHIPIIGGLLAHQRTASTHSHKSQLVDLIVEDTQAEEIERVRARKEGSPGWNRHDPRHFVRAYSGEGDEDQQEEYVREGYEPAGQPNKEPRNQHGIDATGDVFAVGEDEDGDELMDSTALGMHNRTDKTEIDARDDGEGGKAAIDHDAKNRRWKTRNYNEDDHAEDLVRGKEDEEDMRGQNKRQTDREDFGDQEQNPWADGDGK